MNFRHFDSTVSTNDFWLFPIERINQSLERNHQKDTLQRPGISAVFGGPLPAEALERTEMLKSAFQRTITMNGSKASIEWRQNPTAFHFSVYGLIRPDDYLPDQSWPLKDEQMEQLKEAIQTFGGFDLHLRGVGILGMGAVSVRVSDSPELEKLRDAIGAIDGFSKERFGSRTKKIVIGRIVPGLTSQDREVIKRACEMCREIDVGTLHINNLEIVHYKNTFLDAEFERVRLEGKK